MTITLTVSGRIASVDATAHVVAGNTYPVALSLDSEWTGSLYLRVRFGSLYYDIPFASSDASVDVQMPVGYPEVGIGVYSEALEICSCEARIRLLRSILEAGEQVVEFDSDLYDQWAGEVSELLCDDAFDAESDRPVKNSVITAWKDTVPLDANLVHKTGNESVAGQKTFTARMFVREPSIPSIHIVSETAYTATGWKGLVGFFDQKDGASNEAVGIYTSVASGEVNLGLRVHKPNRSGQFDTILRSYDDHQLIITTPYYPVDGSGNPQPIGANALITSGNIAVDPRLVHTTGNETVAGNKEYTGLATFKTVAPTIDCKSTAANTSSGRKGLFRFYDVKDGQPSLYSEVVGYTVSGQTGLALGIYTPGRTGTERTLDLRCYDDAFVVLQDPPHLPVDGSGNPQALTAKALMTSGNIAVDPRIVHTTGNETVAGNKTWNGRMIMSDLRWGLAEASIPSGGWYKFYEVTPGAYGTGAVVKVYNQYDMISSVDWKFVYSIGNSPGYSLGGKRYAMRNLTIKTARRTSDNHVEVWVCNTGGSTVNLTLELMHLRGNAPAVAVQSGSEPVVGDTYTAVYEVTE